MTTSPVMSITDELVSELEFECRLGADQHGGIPAGIARDLERDREEHALINQMADSLEAEA